MHLHPVQSRTTLLCRRSEIADVKRYKEGTTLGMRVSLLNARWNDPPGGPTEDERFHKASELCGSEFSAQLEYIVCCALPARALVEEVRAKRGSVLSAHAHESRRYDGCLCSCTQYPPARSHHLDSARRWCRARRFTLRVRSSSSGTPDARGRLTCTSSRGSTR